MIISNAHMIVDPDNPIVITTEPDEILIFKNCTFKFKSVYERFLGLFKLELIDGIPYKK